MAFKTDLSRVHGLGAAGEGAHHWWMQRISSVALVPLTLLFVLPFGRALGSGYEALIATYSNFFNALVAVLFFLVGFWHLAQGAQVVIEDYVPHKPTRIALLMLNTLICGALAVAGTLAVATILFRA
ncbi:MAG: succinate dehydrogenase, hydrophobic membrane anchor protein [Pararhodobacter sp.]